MDINKIFDYNKNWVNSKLRTDPNYFDNLSKDQKPDMLYIGCADSRVSPGDIMGIQPGEAFVHRNIANMVSNTDVNTMSVINFAVKYLRVNHIIVCGHYGCGGVKAALNPNEAPLLDPWLKNIREVYELHRKELDTIGNDEIKYNKFAELNVKVQCVNILKLNLVQKAYKERDLQIHGWIFDIKTGKLIDLKMDFEKVLRNL
jgi:carbonic anhydrase